MSIKSLVRGRVKLRSIAMEEIQLCRTCGAPLLKGEEQFCSVLCIEEYYLSPTFSSLTSDQL